MTAALTCLLAVLLVGPPVIAAALGRARADADGRAHLRRAAAALWITVAGSAGVLVAGGTSPGGLAYGPLALAGPALVLTPLIALVAAIVATFSIPYMAADPRPRTYAERLLLLSTAALIVGISRDAVLFALAWLATGPLLSLLVGHASGWRPAAAARDRMLRVFAVGDAALVVGTAVLCLQAGSTRIGAIGDAAGAMAPWLRDLGLAGLLAGAVVRSAIVPAGGWLITSITAPTPVSALMHAGLVNAGGIAVALWAPVLAAAPYLLHVIFVLGAATALLGSASMLVRADVKRSLAASTMGQMGFMMMQAGLGQIAYAVYHLAAHGMFKASLFLGSGSAVGVRKPGPPRPAAAVATAATACLAVVAAAIWLPWLELALTDASTLLGMFALLAAAQAVADLPRRGTRTGDLAQGVLLIAGCAAIYVAGLGVVRTALGPLAEIPGLAVTPFHWVVGVVFAALWLTQLVASARGLPVPASIYARLHALGRPRSPERDAALHTARNTPETADTDRTDMRGRGSPAAPRDPAVAAQPAATGDTP